MTFRLYKMCNYQIISVFILSIQNTSKRKIFLKKVINRVMRQLVNEVATFLLPRLQPFVLEVTTFLF